MTRSEDKTAEFDAALEDAHDREIELQLFIAGMGPRSIRAVSHAKEICEILGGRCSVEVVDIYEHPSAARAFQVVAVPALVRNSPKPVRKLVGAIDDALDSLRSLGLPVPAREDAL